MIAVYLLPYPMRGHHAPYLWVFYRLLSSLRERILIIASEDYRRYPSEWAALGRWELQEGSACRLGYQVPEKSRIEEQEYRDLGKLLFNMLLGECNGNPIAAFHKLLTERIPEFEAAFNGIFSDYKKDELEAVLTWCNCPSLKAAAERHGIPVVHLEIGPLRWPVYRPTAYFDFSGVNGNTEADKRYCGNDWKLRSINAEELRRFFTSEPNKSREKIVKYDVGIPLQVEDDSNLVAFGHGFDNQALLVQALLQHSNEKVLVRGHPGSLFCVRSDWYDVDASPGSVEFIRRVRRILTINSSVGLEALLMGKEITVLGDCSYRFIAEAQSEAERIQRLAYYLFGYLVPMDLIYSAEYLRFRLGQPSEREIVSSHLESYGLQVNANEGRCGCLLETALERTQTTSLNQT